MPLGHVSDLCLSLFELPLFDNIIFPPSLFTFHILQSICVSIAESGPQNYPTENHLQVSLQAHTAVSRLPLSQTLANHTCFHLNTFRHSSKPFVWRFLLNSQHAIESYKFWAQAVFLASVSPELQINYVMLFSTAGYTVEYAILL